MAPTLPNQNNTPPNAPAGVTEYEDPKETTKHIVELGSPRKLTVAEWTDIQNRFSYHPPKGNQQDRYIAIQEKAKELAIMIAEFSHTSREQSLALTHLQNATMWANAGIACNE